MASTKLKPVYSYDAVVVRLMQVPPNHKKSRTNRGFWRENKENEHPYRYCRVYATGYEEALQRVLNEYSFWNGNDWQPYIHVQNLTKIRPIE